MPDKHKLPSRNEKLSIEFYAPVYFFFFFFFFFCENTGGHGRCTGNTTKKKRKKMNIVQCIMYNVIVFSGC